MKDPHKFEERYRGFDTRLEGMNLSTQCLHAGEGLAPLNSFPTTTPVYQSTAYYYDASRKLEELLEGQRPGYAYVRWGSPTNAALEIALSTLVGGGRTLAMASGMAADYLALHAAGTGSGKTLLLSREIYGNTYDIVKNAYEEFGVRCIFADFNDLAGLQVKMRSEKPAVVFFEVLTNPMLSVIDAPQVIAMAHAVGAKVVVDNTFATPYLYRPFLDGADFVTHSLTKYINGHGDVMGGSITCREEEFERLEYLACTQGALLSPDCARQVMRGMKTFALRMRQQCENAKALASFLAEQPAVCNLRFPGLPSHPAHQTAKRLFRNDQFGGMVCFDLAGGDKEKCFRFIDALKIAIPAGSLGDVFTLVVHPSSTTHHSLSQEEKQTVGISDATIRVSVGIEDSSDLLNDFSLALDRV